MQSSGVPIDRYSFETIETMKDKAQVMKMRRELLVAQKQLTGLSHAEAEASIAKVEMEVVDISFDAISDPSERDYFMNLPAC